MTRDKLKLKELNLPLFAGLNSAQLKEWENIAILYRLEPDDSLYTQGEISRCMYIILKGGVRLVEYTASGKAVAVKVYGAGDMIGLLSLTQEHKHAATVEAVDETHIIGFRSKEARQLLIEQGLVAMRLIDHLSNHVHHAHDRIRHLAAEKTEQRLARAILHFYKKFGRFQNGVYTIMAEVSQRDIAEFTGTTIETVNRYLRTWEKRQWISLSYKHIDILQAQELENIAASLSGYLPE